MAEKIDMSEKTKVKPAENTGSKANLNMLIPVSVAILLVIVSVVLFINEMPVWSIVSVCFSFAAVAYAFILVTKTVRKAENRIEEMTRERMRQGDFISGFSHRIREPLNNLVIVGELLSATTLNEKQKDLVETLIASTTNMVSTVNELTMQGAETIAFGKRKAIRFNLLSAIQNTVEIFNLKGIAQVDFSVESAAAPGPEITGDPIIIKQIVIDILNNITGSGEQVKPSLKIAIDEPSRSENGINVTIRFSSGSKLLKDFDEDLHDPLSLRLIRENSGKYGYEIIPEGYQLTVSLPFSRAVAEKIHDTVISPKIAELSREKPKKREIRELNMLLVEDNVINQKITYLTLKPLVKSIDTASNGKEALDMIATADYDIILMDIQMPVMDGLVATEKIRALEKSTGKHVPIIAITANAMLGDKEKCLAAGMDDYISKPFHPAALIGKIKDFF